MPPRSLYHQRRAQAAYNMLPTIARHLSVEVLATWLATTVWVRCPITDQPVRVRLRDLTVDHVRCD